jgi:hypothetical protein
MSLDTFEVLDRNGFPLEGAINSPEAVEYRRRANLQATDPVLYRQLYPPTAADIAASQIANQPPQTLAQRLAAIKDPADLAKWIAASNSIMHPVPMTDEQIRKAMQMDPNGPWRFMLKKP